MGIIERKEGISEEGIYFESNTVLKKKDLMRGPIKFENGSKNGFIILLIIYFGLIMTFISLYQRGKVSLLLLVVVIILLFSPLYPAAKTIIKQYAKSSKSFSEIDHEIEIHYIFNNNNLQMSMNNGLVVYEYSSIKSVTASKRAFYMEVGDSELVVISKDSCSQELVEFIEDLKSVYSPTS